MKRIVFYFVDGSNISLNGHIDLEKLNLDTVWIIKGETNLCINPQNILYFTETEM